MWKDFDQCMESCWKEEPPVYLSEKLQQTIRAHPDFSVAPIGPIGNCTVSDQLRREIPESVASSYIVNSPADVAVFRKLISSYNEPHPTVICYSFTDAMYSDVCSGDNFSEIMETLRLENPIIANVLIDHVGMHKLFPSTGKKCILLRYT